MKKLRTQYTPLDEYVQHPEVNEGPSLTEPNMALTPREILDRFATGRPVDYTSDLHYTGEEYFPDIREMDLVEIDELMSNNQSHIAALKSELSEAKKRKKELESQNTVDKSTTDTDADPA